MTVDKGKITEATEDELFAFWLSRDWAEVMSFPDFLRRCAERGVRIIDDEEDAG